MQCKTKANQFSSSTGLGTGTSAEILDPQGPGAFAQPEDFSIKQAFTHIYVYTYIYMYIHIVVFAKGIFNLLASAAFTK